jgi:alkyl hydroperoxide reductase subunit AhpC
MPINTVDHSVGRTPGELLGVATVLQSDELFPCNWAQGNVSDEQTLTAA